jgi:hypothetical protein
LYASDGTTPACSWRTKHTNSSTTFRLSGGSSSNNSESLLTRPEHPMVPCAGDHWVLRQGRLSSYNSDTIRGGFPGFGFTILSVIVTSVVGGAIYYGLVFWSLLIRLSRYHFKLYAADPSSSEVIHHLSGVLTRFLYVAAMLGASGTLITAFPGR